MNRLLFSLVVASGVSASGAVWAQGYTVMSNNPPSAPAPAVVAPSAAASPVAPVPTATAPGSPVGPVEQITPSRARGYGDDRGVVTAHRPEEYGGITPGAPSLPPGFRRLRRAGGATFATWPGFQMVPGGSRVFVALTNPQPLTEASRNGRTRVYHIPSARIGLSNNRRPLITEAFATPVSRVTMRPARGGIDLVIELRADVEPTISQETSGAGFHFVYLGFPPFSSPEIARLLLPNGATVSVPPPQGPAPAAPPPQVQIGAPRPAAPGTDTERPPGVR